MSDQPSFQGQVTGTEWSLHLWFDCLRGHVSFLEIVFVGRCEVFVWLGFA